ncbi:hypothetical protein B0H11DRAFT_2264635 [Mycena galericulata]|nr:hypothetical protein B0H11DRAFT_2264635 [Mycena galericulata]
MHAPHPALPGTASASEHPDPRLTLCALHFADRYPVVLALALLTPLQTAPAVLTALCARASVEPCAPCDAPRAVEQHERRGKKPSRLRAEKEGGGGGGSSNHRDGGRGGGGGGGGSGRGAPSSSHGQSGHGNDGKKPETCT